MITIPKKTFEDLLIVSDFFTALTSQAQESPLDIEKIQDNKTEEAIRNEQRESRFRTEAKAKLSRGKGRSGGCAQRIDPPQITSRLRQKRRLFDLESKLDKRVGDLGELFGVFEVADDTETMIFDSLITLENQSAKKPYHNWPSTEIQRYRRCENYGVY